MPTRCRNFCCGIILWLILLVTTPGIPAGVSPSTDSLRALGAARGFWIGAGDIHISPLSADAQYRDVLAREFNILTPGVAMKFSEVQPDIDRFTFDTADAVVAFARAHDMRVRGHTLVWHEALPQWLTAGQFGPDRLGAILKDHILTEVGHFRGRVSAWDVVNEGLDGGGGLRDTIWLRALGPDYIDQAFRWARQADPDVPLFYNDFGAEGMGPKSDGLYRLVRGMLERGVPIRGVGLQMHVSLDDGPRPADIAANMRRLTALGLEIQITEMDVRIQDTPGPLAEKLAAQARYYHDILRACLAVPKCTALLTWGISDRDSWIPGFFGHADAPLLFDAAFAPKPAYQALARALAGR
ncbi:MAG TPA: endo-1,4-beta-xylanase [bacterium]|nr:endo-1,4-beta-xylanase [bacterium]